MRGSRGVDVVGGLFILDEISQIVRYKRRRNGTYNWSLRYVHVGVREVK